LKQFKAPSVAGPVGLLFALAGYSVAVLVARAFVSLIAHCTESCPAIRLEGFHIHHFYYGLGLVVLSVVGLGLVENVRSRWDVALVLGLGAGLIIDEVGLVLLGARYWGQASLIPILGFGLVLGLGLIYTLRTEGTSDFGFLDRSDFLTILSVLLGVAGFLYFARPVRTVVIVVSVASWVFAVLLMGYHGRKHLLKIVRGQLTTEQ
jgi:hypothetical protein